MATRREKVILELVDNFSTPMARAAASAALFDKSVNKINGSGLQSLERNSDSTGRSINQLTGRLRLFADAAATLGPATVPLGAAALGGVAAMATQLTLTAAAAGTAALAFSGIGDGLKSLNEYQIDPSVANLEKLHVALEKLGPDGAHFVKFLDSIGPKLTGLQMTAREGMFPGVEEGITHLLDLLPQVDRIVGNVAEAMGQLAAEAGAGLSGAGFTAFFDYLESEAKPILIEMGRTVGNFAEGLANLMVGFGPLTADFSGGLLEMSRSFAEWSRTLDENDSFQGLLDYIRESGPQALAFVAALSDAFVGIATAMAPVGSAILPILTNLLEVVAAIASSPLGTVFFAAVAGMAAYSRAASLATAATARLNSGMTSLEKFNAIAGGAKGAAAGIGILALSMTDLDDKAGVSNTAMGALLGTMVLPGWGTAAGAVVGGFLDIKAAADQADAAVSDAFDTIARGSREQLLDTKASLEATLADPGMFDNTDKLKYALAGVNNALEGGLVPADLMGSAIGKTAAEMEAASAAASDLSVSLANLQGFLDKRAALRNTAEAFDALKGELRDGAKEWDRNTVAGRENQAALDNWAQSTLQAADQIKNVKARRTFLSDFRDQLVDLKKAFPDASAAINNVIDALDKQLPPLDLDSKPAENKLNNIVRLMNDYSGMKPSPTVDANTAPANTKINSTDQLLAELSGTTATPNVNLNTGGFFGIFGSVISALNSLDGKTATTYIRTVRTGASAGGGPRDPGYAGGGFTGRGHKYEPAGIVHKNELVLPQEIVSRDWNMLKSRYGHLPGFADGGMVGMTHSRSGDVAGIDDLGRSARRSAHELDKNAESSKKERDGRRKSADQQEQLVERLKSKVDEIRSAVAGAYQQDIFSSGSELTGLGFSSGQLMAQQQQVRDQALSANIKDQREAIRLLKELRKHGLDGPAYVDLAATGDLDALRAYAGLSKRELRHFEKRFELSQSLGNRLEGVASRDVAKHYAAELRELRQINAHLRNNQKDNKKNSDDNAEKVAAGVNRALVAGHKGRA